MDREDEKYYNDYFDLFRSDGWKQLIEELTQNAATINNVAVIKDAEDLFFRQGQLEVCLLYTSPSPRDVEESRMPSSA